jgi:hypothetical protein
VDSCRSFANNRKAPSRVHSQRRWC